MAMGTSSTPLTDALVANERHGNNAESRYWCDQYKTLARKMEADNARLRKALDFYSNDGDWPHEYAMEENEIMLDRGETARIAISKTVSA